MKVHRRTKRKQECFEVGYLHSSPVFYHYINEKKLGFDREFEENKFGVFFKVDR